MLTENNAPFGDTFAVGPITVSNGQHTFQVRALNDTGTLLATNTVTATINNPTPPPPTGDTIATHPARQPEGYIGHRHSVTIAWNAATDNVAVTGYDIYRGQHQVGTTPQTTASFSGLTCGTAY